MSAWLLSIVGVVTLGILLQIVMPKGQTTKYVRGAFSLLVIFVIVSPLTDIGGSAFDFNFDDKTYSIDQTFLDKTSDAYAVTTEEDIENLLLLNGYTADVKIYVKEGTVREIEKIEIILSVSVLEGEELNKHILKVTNLVSARTGVSTKDITIRVRETTQDGDN